MTKLLEGKVAVVTGAARGIGEAVALKFAEHGAHVAFTYVSDSSKDKANALVEKIQHLGVKAIAYQSNAGDFTACEQLVNEVMAAFGQIDICVNNAGISKDNLLLRMTPEQWNEVIQVNLNSVFNMTKQVIKPMMKAKSGSIINMSSVIGEMGNAGQSSYAASKAGVIGFTKTWARELGPKGIRVNAVAPGFIETPILATMPAKVIDEMRDRVPLKRLGRPEDIAQVYAFLASDQAAYINGAVIEVSGGLTV